MDNLNELREGLRNSQLESLKELATTLLKAPLEKNYSMILISGTKENIQVETKIGGDVLDIVPLIESLLEATHKIVSEVPKEYLRVAYKQDKRLLHENLVAIRAITKELADVAKLVEE